MNVARRSPSSRPTNHPTHRDADAVRSLQLSRTLLNLQRELSVTEDRAAYARQYYNDAVLTYNNAVTTVPQRILASVFKFRTREYFRVGGEALGPVRV